MMKFTDSHCHLDFSEFSQHLPELLTQCAKQNIEQIIIPAVNPEHWQRVLSLSKNSTNQVKLHASLGIHPWFIATKDPLQHKNINFEHNSKLLADAVKQHHQDIIAIGECGIDVTKARECTDNISAAEHNIQLQQQYFDFHLQLANEHNLPVIVHHRQSHHLITPLLKQHKISNSGVIHAFSGSYQQAKTYVDLGFKLGIGATITYSRAIKTIETVRKLPLSSLVIETDAPSMPLSGHQGEINSPAMLNKIFQHLCTIRTEPEQVIAEQLELNVQEIFRL